MLSLFKQCWRFIRRVSGDDAYDEYVKHFALHHANIDAQPLSRADFFKEWQDKKWKGVKRCC